MMNCNLARMLLAFPHADLAADDRDSLTAHVAGCPHCASVSAGEASLHAAFAKAMRAVPVPADLHSKLLREGFAQRGARHRRQIYQWSSLAAGLLLVIGLGYGGYLRNRPDLDTNDIAIKTDQDSSGPREPVHAWLAGQDLPSDLPFDIDYRYYATHGHKELVGRDTPMILFHGQFGTPVIQTATVFIVDTSRFKIQDLKNAQASLVYVTVKQHANRPDIAYVIVSTTETIEPFLKRIGPAA